MDNTTLQRVADNSDNPDEPHVGELGVEGYCGECGKPCTIDEWGQCCASFCSGLVDERASSCFGAPIFKDKGLKKPY